MPDFITHHEDRWPRIPYLIFVAQKYAEEGLTRILGGLPPTDRIRGIVPVSVNHGRWMIDCPNVGCNNALIASRETPLFICTECGSPENDHSWYAVLYPANKVEIEEVLLRRRALHPFKNAAHRNWLAGETTDDLRRQNFEHADHVKDRATKDIDELVAHGRDPRPKPERPDGPTKGND